MVCLCNRSVLVVRIAASIEYSSNSGKAPGGWGFFPLIWGEASKKKKPTPWGFSRVSSVTLFLIASSSSCGNLFTKAYAECSCGRKANINCTFQKCKRCCQSEIRACKTHKIKKPLTVQLRELILLKGQVYVL